MRKNIKKAVSALMAFSLMASGLAGFSSAFAANSAVNAGADGQAGALTAYKETAVNTRTGKIWDQVKLLGRTHVRDDGTLWLALSGTGMEFSYQGPAFTITILGDSNCENTSTNQSNAAKVAFYVDGEQQKKEMVRQKEITFQVPESTGKEVTIRVLKLSESYPSTIGIKPFSVPEGGTIQPTEAKKYKIEFIGDSITCGVGVEAVNGTAGEKDIDKEDITKAYSYKTAQLLDADYSMVSYAGHGVIAGYTGTPGVKDTSNGKDERLPLVYDKFGKSWSNFIAYGDASGNPETVNWDFSRFVTDVVVVNLGTNDFSYCRVNDTSKYEVDAARGEEYVTGYVGFLKTVREKNPKAEIFCVVGPGGGPMDPYIEKAVKQYSEENSDTKVHAFPFGTIEGANAAGGYHPNEAAHTTTAKKLADFIRPYLESASYEPERLGVAVCGQFLTPERPGECQWYAGSKASGEDAAIIAGASGSVYLPSANDIGKWLFCVGKDMKVTDENCDRFKVVGSLKEESIDYGYDPDNSNNDNTGNKFIKNIGTNASYVDPSKWVPGGYLKVTMSSSITKPDSVQMMYNAWADKARPNKNLNFSKKMENEDNTVSFYWTYEDILLNWYNDPDFAGWNALRIVHDSSDNDVIKPSLKAEYIGPSMTAPTESINVPEVVAYDESANAGEGKAFQWLTATKASGADAQVIQGAAGRTYQPTLEDIGGWLLCSKQEDDGTASIKKFRVVASKDTKQIEYPGAGTKIGNYHLAFLSNTVANSGKIDPSKWAPGGYVEIVVKGIAFNKEKLPQLDLGTWTPVTVTGRATKDVNPSSSTENQGEITLRYTYEDIFNAWYSDGDFQDLKALRVKYDGTDEANMEIVSAKYVGPILSYGELGETVELRGNASGYQYLFTRHVGGKEFDATTLENNDEFYVEYKDDKRDSLRLVAQCHSARAGEEVKSTYATIAPAETGKTGSGYYSIFKVSQIKETFGSKFRYIDGLRIAFASDGDKLTSNASLYLFKKGGGLVDDISSDGYDDAIKVPWTLYDDTDKKGIAVIGASITQNPLVTPLAMSGEPFYSAKGSWGAMLDRTDIVTYGIGSQTTNDISARFHEVLDYGYEKIVIQCGNNDLGTFDGEDAPQKAAEQAVRNYTTMLDQAAAKNIPVYIISLNPVSSEKTNSKIPTVIAELKKLCEERYNGLVTYVDVFNEFKDPVNNRSQEDLVMSDGLHPVAKGYAIYAKHLKELLASNDEKDTSLVSLSWRKTTREKKNIVTGFASADSGKKEFTVELGSSAADDEVIRLYETPNNLNAKVTVEGAEGNEIKTEEYQVTEAKEVEREGSKVSVPAVIKTDDYVEVKLVNGSRTVKLTVESEDGSTSSTYTITFTNGNGGGNVSGSNPVYQGEEKYQTLTDDNCVANNWSYLAWQDAEVKEAITDGKKYRMEFDVEIENRQFSKLYIDGKAEWEVVTDYYNLTPEDFNANNLYHVSSGEFSLSSIGKSEVTVLSVTVGDAEKTDYRGSVTIKNVKLVPVESGSASE